MPKKINEAELDLLTRVSMYLLEDPSNIDNLLAVIADCMEAKQVVIAWQEMSEEEATNVDCAGFASKVITDVEGGSKVLGMARNDTQWSVSCQLAFAVNAAFMTMIRNEVMDNYTEERVDAYKVFIEELQRSSVSGTNAVTVTQ